MFAGEMRKPFSLRCCCQEVAFLGKQAPSPLVFYFQQHFSAAFPGQKDTGINSVFLPRMCVFAGGVFSSDSVAFRFIGCTSSYIAVAGSLFYFLR